jgi:hypothetical protein
MSIGEVHYFIETQFHLSVERNTLWHILKRDPSVKSCRNIPMEEARLDLTTQAGIDFFRRATEVAQGVPAHFVFNMNEMGHQDWADRTQKTSLVPSSHAEEYVYVSVSRPGKLITLITCMAADGSALKPEIIVPRKTVDADLVLTGLMAEKRTIRSQPPGFIDTRIFESCCETMFIPELHNRRTKHD